MELPLDKNKKLPWGLQETDLAKKSWGKKGSISFASWQKSGGKNLGILQSRKEFFGCFWNFLECSGMFWKFLDSFGMLVLFVEKM